MSGTDVKIIYKCQENCAVLCACSYGMRNVVEVNITAVINYGS